MPRDFGGSPAFAPFDFAFFSRFDFFSAFAFLPTITPV